jgi:hypothetical protein
MGASFRCLFNEANKCRGDLWAYDPGRLALRKETAGAPLPPYATMAPNQAARHGSGFLAEPMNRSVSCRLPGQSG